MSLKEFIIGYVCVNRQCLRTTKTASELCPFCGKKTLNEFYDFYRVFNLSPSYTVEDLKKSYKNLSLKYHPDVNGGDDSSFLVVSSGYNIFSDTNKKYIYDQTYRNVLNSDQQSQNSQQNSGQNAYGGYQQTNQQSHQQNPFGNTQNDAFYYNFKHTAQNQEEFFRVLYEMFDTIHRQKQADPMVRLRKMRFVSSVLSALFFSAMGYMFDLQMILMAVAGFFLGRSTKEWFNRTLFNLNDFFLPFIAIREIFITHYSFGSIMTSLFFLIIYFVLTQRWRKQLYPS